MWVASILPDSGPSCLLSPSILWFLWIEPGHQLSLGLHMIPAPLTLSFLSLWDPFTLPTMATGLLQEDFVGTLG